MKSKATDLKPAIQALKEARATLVAVERTLLSSRRAAQKLANLSEALAKQTYVSQQIWRRLFAQTDKVLKDHDSLTAQLTLATRNVIAAEKHALKIKIKSRVV